MSMYIIFDTGKPIQVASNLGWSLFGDWIDNLSGRKYPDLIHLREYGWTEPAKQLRKELAAALATTPPECPDTRAVAVELLDLLKGKRTAVVSLSNGLVAEEDDSENRAGA